MTHTDSAAVRKVGIVGWEPCIFERVTGGMLIAGGIPKIVNGKKKWPAKKLMEQVILTLDDLKAEETRYESETGNCKVCYGTGKATVGWKSTEGILYRECPRCKGGGKAPQQDNRTIQDDS